METLDTSTNQADDPPEPFGSRFGMEGQIIPPRLSFAYQVALLLVLVAVTLLPILYLGLIGLVGCGAFQFARKDTEVWSVVLGVVAIFLIKPVFARRQKAAPTVAVTAEQEPVLFEFIRDVSAQMGSPMPQRIEVDCQVNAAAGFRRGFFSFWRDDLVLQVGLPLVAAFNTREFAGVLAHELGHFSQRFGMRLSFLINRINFWFFRVVYQRDSWDAHLVRWSQEAGRIHLGLALIFYLMRAGVWLTRRVLWVLFFLSRLLSSYTCRQMEYNADLYDVKIAGSESQAVQLNQLELLNLAELKAQSALAELLRSQRLPANLPRFILRLAQRFTPAESLAARDPKPGQWFDTHPPTAERLRRAERAAAPGVFTTTQPATDLFQDFEALAQSVSARHYQEILGLELQAAVLADTEATAAETHLVEACEAAFQRYFAAHLSQLRPFTLTESQLAPLPNPNDSLARLNACRTAMQANAVAANAVSDRYAEAYVHLRTARMALQMMDAGYVIPESDFKTPGLTLLESLHARIAALQKDQPLVLTLAEFESTAQARLAAALQLLPVPEVAARMGDSTLAPEALHLTQVLQRVGEIIPCLLELDHCAVMFSMLNKNNGGARGPRIEQAVQAAAAGAHANLREVESRLTGLRYPFPHARPNLSVLEYVQIGISTSPPLGHLEHQCATYVSQLLALNKRAMGRLAMIAETIEAQVVAA